MRILHNIKIPLSSDKEIKKIKQTNKKQTHHGNKIWDSSMTMIDFLSRYNLYPIDDAIEIGCGWGVVLSYLEQNYVNAVGIDIDESTGDFAEVVEELNGEELNILYGDYTQMPKEGWQAADLVVACDMCYWEEHIENLVKVIDQCKGTVLIADAGRETFWELTNMVDGNLHEIKLNKPKKVHGYVYEIIK
tara:strand:+ start:296 stop:865 length:570 start_codon:yes stop_codon:yes gene_type:complete